MGQASNLAINPALYARMPFDPLKDFTPIVGVSAQRPARAGAPLQHLAWDGTARPRWLQGTALRTLLKHGMPHFENSQAERGAPILPRNLSRDFGNRDHLSWAHLRLIRQRWKGRLVLKGVMSVDDALAARDCGVEGRRARRAPRDRHPVAGDPAQHDAAGAQPAGRGARRAGGAAGQWPCPSVPSPSVKPSER